MLQPAESGLRTGAIISGRVLVAETMILELATDSGKFGENTGASNPEESPVERLG